MAKNTKVPAKSKNTSVRPASRAHEERAYEALMKFRVIYSTVKKHFQDIESKCDVSGAQLWALSEVADTPGLRVSELARAMSVHQSTASNLVRDLERKGLIRKERGEDQRVVRLHLTCQGNNVVARAPKPVMGVLPDALRRLPEEVLNNLNMSMDALIDIIEIKDETAATKPLSDI